MTLPWPFSPAVRRGLPVTFRRRWPRVEVRSSQHPPRRLRVVVHRSCIRGQQHRRVPLCAANLLVQRRAHDPHPPGPVPLLLSPRGWGCDCVSRAGVEDSDLVFIGQLTHANRWRRIDRQEPSFTRFTFSASDVVKGPRRISYLVDTGNTDCGALFAAGKRYRVFASGRFAKDGIEWYTSVCTMNEEVPPQP
jgi:hypothetical protein